MAKAHFVNKARKDNPAVQKGESYWWWKFRFGSKRYSATKPTRGQLTQSYFYQTLYGIQDDITAMDDPTQLEDIMAAIEELRDECECSFDNMPGQLQDTSDSGIMLEQRIYELGNWHSELDGIDTDPGDLDGADLEEWLEEVLNEIQACEINV